MNYHFALVERKNYNIKKIYDLDYKFKKIAKDKKGDYHLFVYELPNLKEDE